MPSRALLEPVLPGATWRALSPSDAASIEQLLEAARRADGGEEVSTRDDVLRQLGGSPGPGSDEHASGRAQ